MLIASYDQWREAKKQVLEEENPEIDCEECGGLGEIYERCHCCGAEKEDATSVMVAEPSAIWIPQSLGRAMIWSAKEFTSRK
jgi:recombinational DNA repair protein RecR